MRPLTVTYVISWLICQCCRMSCIEESSAILQPLLSSFPLRFAACLLMIYNSNYWYVPDPSPFIQSSWLRSKDWNVLVLMLFICSNKKQGTVTYMYMYPYSYMLCIYFAPSLWGYIPLLWDPDSQMYLPCLLEISLPGNPTALEISLHGKGSAGTCMCTGWKGWCSWSVGVAKVYCRRDWNWTKYMVSSGRSRSGECFTA